MPPRAPRFVVYRRASTARQGTSGLGLEAQQAACEALVASKGGRIVATFTEIESGKVNERPQLRAALYEAKVCNATLVIARLDRLSRNAAFLLTLRDSGVRFVAADMPDANNLTVGILALVAQEERETISSRTRAALVAAKARGQVLGNPNGAAALRRAGKVGAATGGVVALQAKADQAARELAPMIERLRRDGVTTLRGLARALTDLGTPTPSQFGRNLEATGEAPKEWKAATVANLLERLKRA